MSHTILTLEGTTATTLQFVEKQIADLAWEITEGDQQIERVRKRQAENHQLIATLTADRDALVAAGRF